MSIVLLVIGLLLFIGLIVFHELGHFIIARRNGVEPEEFGIFFPPRLWSRKTKKGWEFSINLLPLGGFVRLKGEHDSDTEKGSYGASKLGVKAKILLAGVGMNLLAAFLLLTILSWVGMPQIVNNQYTVKSDTHVTKNEVLVGYVEPGSPASHIGLKTTDRLLELIPKSGSKEIISNANNLPAQTKKLAGQTIQIQYEHNNQIFVKSVTLRSQKVVSASQKSNSPKGYLGISPSQYNIDHSTWSAPVVAVGLMVQLTALTFHGLGTALAGLFSGNLTQASSQVSGPVGIFEILKSGSLLGYQFILMIVAVISLSLAIMNVLPVPPLDGGKLFMTLAWRSLHKKLTEAVENTVNSIGLVFFLILFVLITIADVRK